MKEMSGGASLVGVWGDRHFIVVRGVSLDHDVQSSELPEIEKIFNRDFFAEVYLELFPNITHITLLKDSMEKKEGKTYFSAQEYHYGDDLMKKTSKIFRMTAKKLEEAGVTKKFEKKGNLDNFEVIQVEFQSLEEARKKLKAVLEAIVKSNKSVNLSNKYGL